MTGQTQRPNVKWAQRDDALWFTVFIQDAKDVKVDLKEDSLKFGADSEKDAKHYEFDVEFPAKIKPDESKHRISGRLIEFYLKKETEETWSSPMKKGVKNWMAVDWDKWVDSDDEGDDKGDFDLSGMGGMGGMPGMGGMGGMGGMPGMGDMGGFDMSKLAESMKNSGMDGEGDEDSDDEIADLDQKADIGENTDVTKVPATKESAIDASVESSTPA